MIKNVKKKMKDFLDNNLFGTQKEKNKKDKKRKKQIKLKENEYEKDNKKTLESELYDRLTKWAYQWIQQNLIERMTPKYFVKEVVEGIFSERWDIVSQSIAGGSDYWQYEDAVVNCPLRILEIKKFLNMTLEENSNITRRLFQFYKEKKRTIWDKELKDKIDQIIEDVVKDAIQDQEIQQKIIKKRKQYYKKNWKFYSALLNYKKQGIRNFPKMSFFIVEDKKQGSYIFSNKTMTMNKLWNMATGVSDINNYKIVILEDEIFRMWKDEVDTYTNIRLDTIRNVSIPELRAYLYTTLLPEWKEFWDFKITIPRWTEKTLIQVGYKDWYRLISHNNSASTVYTFDSLRTSVRELGWETNRRNAPIDLKVGNSRYRGQLTTNAQWITLVLRADGEYLKNPNQLAEKVNLPTRSIEDHIIKPDLLDYVDNKDTYNQKKQDFLNEDRDIFFLDPYKKITQTKINGEEREANYYHNYPIPYDEEFTNRIVEAAQDQKNGWLIFWAAPTANWKSTSAQKIINKVYAKTIEEKNVNLNFYTAENPIENINQYLTQFKIEDMGDGDYEELVSSLKRMDPDNVFVWELRNSSVFSEVQSLANSFPVLSTVHADSLSNFFKELSWKYISQSPGLTNSSVFSGLSMVIVQRVFTLANPDSKKLEFTDNIDQKINTIRNSFTGKELKPKEKKMFEKIKKVLENHNKKGLLKQMPKKTKDKQEQLFREYADNTYISNYIKAVNEDKSTPHINQEIQSERIYSHIPLDKTIFYMALKKVLEGQLTLEEIPLKEYASQSVDLVINITDKLDKDLKAKSNK